MNELSLKKRLALFIGVVLIQCLYTPSSLLMTGGIAPKSPLDNFPLWPIWVVPYVLCFPMWFLLSFWAIFKMETRLFRALVIAGLFTGSCGILTYLFFPTYVIHPQLIGNDIFVRTLQWIYTAGGSYDALPSAHIYMTTLFMFFYHRWYPRLRILWIGILIIVALSTLFTMQHYIADIMAGIVVAWLGYSFGLWWAGLRKNSRQVTPVAK